MTHPTQQGQWVPHCAFTDPKCPQAQKTPYQTRPDRPIANPPRPSRAQGPPKTLTNRGIGGGPEYVRAVVLVSPRWGWSRGWVGWGGGLFGRAAARLVCVCRRFLRRSDLGLWAWEGDISKITLARCHEVCLLFGVSERPVPAPSPTYHPRRGVRSGLVLT